MAVKYKKQVLQYSTDGGSTWQNVEPQQYRKGDVLEYGSVECENVMKYLTFKVTSAGTFTFRGNNSFANSVQYSLNSGSTWTTLAPNTATPSIAANSTIMWRASLTPQLIGTDMGIGTFSSTAKFEAEGNAYSLLYGDNFADVRDLTGKNYALAALFSGCTGITSAERLAIPAFKLSNGCYSYMFSECSNLTTPPILHANQLADGCYDSMFSFCTNLTVAPTLSATTLSDNCYSFMFYGCTSLISAPQLPATELAESCYYHMFASCTSMATAPTLSATTLQPSCYNRMFYGASALSSVTCLATNISANQCTNNWLYGVSSSGTFYKASSMSNWGSGVSGIPTNWTIRNA
ncbi:MAG: hypothetical protein J6S67_13645 [Methanobrevibacter sp.]|nr:hypothetical protein [Methanobrevibacter sp.]